MLRLIFPRSINHCGDGSLSHVLVFSFLLLQGAGVVMASEIQVVSHAKISNTAGNFTGQLDDLDLFGICVSSLGDLDGDGVADLAVGASQDDDGGHNRGAVWILFLNSDGTVKRHQKISEHEGRFLSTLDDNDRFGVGLAPIGDLDGDGVPELAVGAHGDDDGGFEQGAVWILFLTPTGFVKRDRKISATSGGFTGELDWVDIFGSSLSAIGDLDGDGVKDVIVGAPWDDDGGQESGAVYVLFLLANGEVKGHQKISSLQGDFRGHVAAGDLFGRSVACLGDIDGDGYIEVAVGAVLDDDGGPGFGAVYILTLNTDGTVRSARKISKTEGGFSGALEIRDQFGISVATVGDLDSDGVIELLVGANGDDDGGIDRGAAWLLFLNRDGTVKSHQKISDTAGDFGGQLDDTDSFGISVAAAGDIDGNGVGEIAVGATEDDDGGMARGAVWVLFLAKEETVPAPPAFSLEPNQPNPFASGTRIDFTLDRGLNVSLEIYDVSGRLVRTLVERWMPEGPHAADWDGRDGLGHPVPSGLYFYRLSTATGAITNKALLIR